MAAGNLAVSIKVTMSVVPAVMYIAIIYDIPDDVAKDFTPTTPQELLDFVEQYKRRDPESVEAAKEMIK